MIGQIDYENLNPELAKKIQDSVDKNAKASTDDLGLIRIDGTTITIDDDGIIKATGNDMSGLVKTVNSQSPDENGNVNTAFRIINAVRMDINWTDDIYPLGISEFTANYDPANYADYIAAHPSYEVLPKGKLMVRTYKDTISSPAVVWQFIDSTEDNVFYAQFFRVGNLDGTWGEINIDNPSHIIHLKNPLPPSAIITDYPRGVSVFDATYDESNPEWYDALGLMDKELYKADTGKHPSGSISVTSFRNNTLINQIIQLTDATGTAGTFARYYDTEADELQWIGGNTLDSGLDGRVRSVNGKKPSVNGNVEIEIPNNEILLPSTEYYFSESLGSDNGDGSGEAPYKNVNNFLSSIKGKKVINEELIRLYIYDVITNSTISFDLVDCKSIEIESINPDDMVTLDSITVKNCNSDITIKKFKVKQFTIEDNSGNIKLTECETTGGVSDTLLIDNSTVNVEVCTFNAPTSTIVNAYNNATVKLYYCSSNAPDALGLTAEGYSFIYYDNCPELLIKKPETTYCSAVIDLVALDDLDGEPYILPVATDSVLGGVMVDNVTIKVDSDGVISTLNINTPAEAIPFTTSLTPLTSDTWTYTPSANIKDEDTLLLFYNGGALSRAEYELSPTEPKLITLNVDENSIESYNVVTGVIFRGDIQGAPTNAYMTKPFTATSENHPFFKYIYKPSIPLKLTDDNLDVYFRGSYIRRGTYSLVEADGEVVFIVPYGNDEPIRQDTLVGRVYRGFDQ